jgi:hypothetical protein
MAIHSTEVFILTPDEGFEDAIRWHLERHPNAYRVSARYVDVFKGDQWVSNGVEVRSSEPEAE